MVIASLVVTETHMAEVFLATLGIIYALRGEIFSQIQLKMNFPIYFSESSDLPKLKPLSIDIFHRPLNVNTFLETFVNDLNFIDLKKP